MKENSIVFKGADSTEGVISSVGTVLKDGTNSSTQTAKILGFESGTQGLSGSKVTADYIKAGMIEMSATWVKEIYRAADNACGVDDLENAGKAFSIRLKSNRNIYSFICGKKDGFELGSGRAYLTSFSGINYSRPITDPSIKITTPCSTWHPMLPGVDNCQGVIPADSRVNNSVRKLDFVKDIEAVNVWRNGSCRKIPSGSEHSAVCRAVNPFVLPGGEPIYAYEFNQSIINHMETINANAAPHKDCTASGIGNWSGDLQNIFVLRDGQSDNAINHGHCDNLKYHD